MTLAQLITTRLTDLELSQTELCRRCDFDQGLLSKLANGVLTRVSLESALRLAKGLDVAPRVVFVASGRPDWVELIRSVYGISEPTE